MLEWKLRWILNLSVFIQSSRSLGLWLIQWYYNINMTLGTEQIKCCDYVSWFFLFWTVIFFWLKFKIKCRLTSYYVCSYYRLISYYVCCMWQNHLNTDHENLKCLIMVRKQWNALKSWNFKKKTTPDGTWT